MNVRVSVGGEDDNDDSSDSDSELAQVKQKVEDEGDPWAANEEGMMPSEENLLLSAKGETGLGLGGLGDDVSHRVRISYLFRHYLFLDVLNSVLLSDKMLCRVGFVNSYLKAPVAVVYLPCCLWPCYQGRLGEHLQKEMCTISIYEAFCHVVSYV